MPDYLFFLSYAHADRDVRNDSIAKFYSDLASLVGGRAPSPPDPVGFFDYDCIRGGDDWPQVLVDALQSSCVLVCLFSPRYFESEYCGKELAIFRQRIARFVADQSGALPPRVIQPVFWQPRTVLTLPPAVTHTQYLDNTDPLEYAERGLKDIMWTRDTVVYRKVVAALASRIAHVVITAPPLPRVPLLDITTIPNAFLDPPPDGAPPPPPPVLPSPEQTYLDYFVSKYRSDASSQEIGLSLRELYQEPALTDRVARPDVASPQRLPAQTPSLSEMLDFDLLQPRDGATLFQQLVTAVQRAREPQRTLIVGAPGMGKTTLLKMVGVESAQRGRPLPVFIELRHYAPGRVESKVTTSTVLDELSEYIHQSIGVHFVGISQAEVRQRLVRGGYLLLLDGLDEITDPALRYRTVIHLNEVKDATDCSILVTSRTATKVAYSLNYDVRELLSLAPVQIEAYVRIWFRATPHRGEALLQQAQENRRLRRMLGTPMLLHMMVRWLKDLPEGQYVIPDRRVGLYDSFIRQLLERRPLLLLGSSAPDLLQSETERQDYLARLAYWLHNREWWYSPKNGLFDVLRDMLRERHDWSTVSAEQLLAVLVEQVALLQQLQPDHYAFSHFTFQEFFAALYLARLGDREAVPVLLARSLDSWWHEVITIYAFKRPNSQLLTALWRADDTIFATHALLLVDCLSAAGDRKHALVERLHAHLVELYSTQRSEWLQTRLFAALLRLEAPSLPHFLREELRRPRRDRRKRAILALSESGGRGSDVAHVLMEVYRSDAAYRTERELIRAVTQALVVLDATVAQEFIQDRMGDDLPLCDEIAAALIAAGQPEAREVLLSLLRDTHTPARMRETLARRLGPVEPDIVREVVEPWWQVDDDRRRIELLDIITFPASEELLRAARAMLESKEVNQVIAAVRFLARHRDPESLDALIERLLDHPGEPLEHELLQALAVIHDETTEEWLLYWVGPSGPSQPAPPIEAAAVRALGALGGVASVEPLVARLRWVVPARSPIEVVSALIAALDAIHRRAALTLDSEVGALALEAARPALQTDDEAARAVVSLLLGAGDRGTAAALLDLAPSHEALSYALVGWLQQQHLLPEQVAPDVEAAVARLAADDSNESLAALAFHELMRLSRARPEAWRNNMLLRAFTGKNALKCVAALRIVQNDGNNELWRAVVNLLDHPDGRVVRQAIEVLGEFGKPESVDALTPCLYAPQVEVADAALGALHEIATWNRLLHLETFRSHHPRGGSDR